MADLVVTSTSVVAGNDATINKDYRFGETVTAGAPVYRDSSTNLLMNALASNTAAKAAAMGVALNGGAINQPAQVQTGGTITIGATVANGTIYVVSANSGKIAPWADLVATNFVTILGIGSTTGVITLFPNPTGIAHA